jgi:hypothetical protein
MSSLSEILRVGGWALRGIGYPFGVAERAVRLLAWSEASGAKAIAGLRLAEPAVARSQSAAPCERAGDAGSGRVVHAKGRHLLEMGAPAVDLVTHDARRGSAGHVAVDGVFGLGLLPSLANLLAHRKLSGLFVYGAAEADPMPAGWPRTGWLLVHWAADGPVFARGKLERGTGMVLQEALEAMRGTLPSKILDATRAFIGAGAASPGGYMGILAVAEAHALVRDLVATLRGLSGDVELIDFPRRVADALRDGIPMDADDLKYLYDLELRTWAPTSERSRSQAGYGVYQNG